MNNALIQALPGPALAGGQGAAELAARGEKGLPWRCCQGLPGCKASSVLSLDIRSRSVCLKAEFLPCYSNLLEERIRPLWIEHLIAGHDCDKVLCVRQIDDVVGPTWNHVNSFNLVSRYFKLYSLTGIDVSFLNQAVTLDNNEKLSFAVMPVITLSVLNLKSAFKASKETSTACKPQLLSL